MNECFLSGRCESFRDDTYILLTLKYPSQCHVNFHLGSYKLQSKDILYIVGETLLGLIHLIVSSKKTPNHF